MRYMMLTCETDKEKSVLNPRTCKMIVEKKDGSISMKNVNKLFVKRCIDDALSGENGWNIIFYDDLEPAYKERL